MTAAVVEIPIRGKGSANVLDRDAMARLEVALISAEHRGARAAILHGPPGRFAAGADLSVLEGLSGPGAHRFGRDGARLFRRLERSPLWLAAAVEGHCIGGGLDVALACDLILATDSARFRHPGARLGFPTTYGGNRRLPLRVGMAGARDLLLRGREIGARAALDVGLVQEVVPGEDLLGRARRLLERWVAGTTPESARSLQAIFRLLPGLPAASARALERGILRHHVASC